MSVSRVVRLNLNHNTNHVMKLLNAISTLALFGLLFTFMPTPEPAHADPGLGECYYGDCLDHGCDMYMGGGCTAMYCSNGYFVCYSTNGRDDLHYE